MSKIGLYSIIYTLTFCLAGCAGTMFTPVKLPETKTYKLENNTDALNPKRAKYDHKHKKTLLISIPTAAPGYQTEEMVYLQHPFELSRFAHNKWAAAPAQMLQTLLAEKLRNTGYFFAVITTPSTGKAELRLEAQLLKLQQSFLTKPSRVYMQLQIQLFDNNTNEIMFDHGLTTVVSAPSDTPQGYAIAANQITNKLLDGIAVFVEKNINRQK